VLEGMAGLLRNWGCQVVSAATPEAALADISRIGRETRPDLIISDYHLNDGESGITEVAKLREAYGVVPAFVMSGDTAPHRLREARASAPTPVAQTGSTHEAARDAEPIPHVLAPMRIQPRGKISFLHPRCRRPSNRLLESGAAVAARLPGISITAGAVAPTIGIARSVLSI
jgi:CheY-like chemotaxis protein